MQEDLESQCSEYNVAFRSARGRNGSRATTPMSSYGPEDTHSMLSARSNTSRTRSRTPVSMYGAQSECYSLASLGSYYDMNASTLRRIVPRSDYKRVDSFVNETLSTRKGVWSATPRFSRIMPNACRCK